MDIAGRFGPLQGRPPFKKAAAERLWANDGITPMLLAQGGLEVSGGGPTSVLRQMGCICVELARGVLGQPAPDAELRSTPLPVEAWDELQVEVDAMHETTAWRQSEAMSASGQYFQVPRWMQPDFVKYNQRVSPPEADLDFGEFRGQPKNLHRHGAARLDASGMDGLGATAHWQATAVHTADHRTSLGGAQLNARTIVQRAEEAGIGGLANASPAETAKIIKKWKMDELKRRCARYGLSPDGSPAELRKRLTAHLIEEAPVPDPEANSEGSRQDSRAGHQQDSPASHGQEPLVHKSPAKLGKRKSVRKVRSNDKP